MANAAVASQILEGDRAGHLFLAASESPPPIIKGHAKGPAPLSLPGQRCTYEFCGRRKNMPPDTLPEMIMFFAALATAAAAVAGGFLVRGSTAVPAAAWGVVAAVALAIDAGSRAGGWLVDPAARASVRLAVVALAVCPAMSLLGAKRPQHGVWQLIVGTLFIVLAMPAASAALVRPGSMPDIHLLERFFLPVLVAVGWMNFLTTRHGLAASLVAAGQAGFVLPFLPGMSQANPPVAHVDAVCGCLLAAGGGLAVVQSAGWPVRAAGRAGLAAIIDPPFLALRETLGAAWTLRIIERFNSMAAARSWPCRLRFGGLEVSDGTGSEWQREAVRGCRSILRRFVSVEWLERHGGLRLPPGESFGQSHHSPFGGAGW
jgi:hypothetical protein